MPFQGLPTSKTWHVVLIALSGMWLGNCDQNYSKLYRIIVRNVPNAEEGGATERMMHIDDLHAAMKRRASFQACGDRKI